MSFLLQAVNIKKQYGARTVLDFQSMQIYERDKIGVVGLNGAGKSTLLGILSGQIEPDEGVVTTGCEMAFIRQFGETDRTLSGGENVKKRIQSETGRSDQIVFADEPTANLDEDGVKWVRKKLTAASTVVLVSHDRDLLDAVCTRIVEVKDGALHFYTGNYSDYARALEEQKRKREQEYQEYQRKKIQLEAAVQTKVHKVSEMRSRHKQQLKQNSSENRLRGDKREAKNKKVQRGAQVLKNRLERLPQVEKERELPRLRMDFSLTDPPRNRYVVTCEGLSFAYGERMIFDGADFLVPCGEKIAVTGKNGAGKTTLLRLIYEGHEAIRCAPKLKPGFLYQGFEDLDLYGTVLDNVRGTAVQDMASVRSILAGLLFTGDDVYKKAEVLSGGERLRLSLAKLLASDCNALLLDEPTNYLDLRSVQAVGELIRQYPGTVLLVSHDRRFVEETTQMELLVEDGKVLPRERQEQKPPKPADKMVLELRRAQLAGRISSAPPEEKTLLKAELNGIVEQLRSL